MSGHSPHFLESHLYNSLEKAGPYVSRAGFPFLQPNQSPTIG
jgi:hypothetical protein